MAKSCSAFYNKIKKLCNAFTMANVNEGEYATDPLERLVVATIAGTLYVTPSYSGKEGDPYFIFCRFEDIGRVKEILKHHHKLNPHSGKFNFSSLDKNILLADFTAELINLCV